jgi:copper chaperone CopZ
MNYKSVAAIAFLMCLAVNPVGAVDKSGSGGAVFVNKVSADSITPNMVSMGKTNTASLKMSALHRMDFVVSGTSCATCVLRVQKRLQDAPGIAKVAVMLRRPFAGVLIYDSTKQDTNKLTMIASGQEKNIKLDKVEDAAIARIPLVLVPHHATD